MNSVNRSLRNNGFGSLNLSTKIGSKLQLVDLQDNRVSVLDLGSEFKSTVM